MVFRLHWLNIVRPAETEPENKQWKSWASEFLELVAHSYFQSGDTFGAYLMHNAAQFLDPFAQPDQLFLADFVMF
jgi:hypothetical protein